MKTLALAKDGTLKLTPEVCARLGNVAKVSFQEMAGGFFIAPVFPNRKETSADGSPFGWRTVFGIVPHADTSAVDAVIASEFETINPDDWK
jgi:hypothetical protein